MLRAGCYWWIKLKRILLNTDGIPGFLYFVVFKRTDKRKTYHLSTDYSRRVVSLIPGLVLWVINQPQVDGKNLLCKDLWPSGRETRQQSHVQSNAVHRVIQTGQKNKLNKTPVGVRSGGGCQTKCVTQHKYSPRDFHCSPEKQAPQSVQFHRHLSSSRPTDVHTSTRPHVTRCRDDATKAEQALTLSYVRVTLGQRP